MIFLIFFFFFLRKRSLDERCKSLSASVRVYDLYSRCTLIPNFCAGSYSRLGFGSRLLLLGSALHLLSELALSIENSVRVNMHWKNPGIGVLQTAVTPLVTFAIE